MYEMLKREGIPHPRYAVLDRDSGDAELSRLVEGEDSIEVSLLPWQPNPNRTNATARLGERR